MSDNDQDRILGSALNSAGYLASAGSRFQSHIVGDTMLPHYPAGLRCEFEMLADKRDLNVGSDYLFFLTDGSCLFRRLEKVGRRGFLIQGTNPAGDQNAIQLSQREVTGVARTCWRMLPPLG